jgi:hypothetical protein
MSKVSSQYSIYTVNINVVILLSNVVSIKCSKIAENQYSEITQQVWM